MSAKDELAAWLEAREIRLAEDRWALIEGYLRDVEEHNRRVNLTADSGDSLLLRHAADGLAALPLLRRVLPRGGSALDLGAGAGFVGVTLKIAWPDLSVTLMESSEKKFRFLNWEAARLNLKGLSVVLGRAPLPRGPLFDAVLARAVAPLPEVVGMAMPLTREGGAFIAYQSRPADPGDPAFRKALSAASAAVSEDIPYRLPREPEDRHLVVIKHKG